MQIFFELVFLLAIITIPTIAIMAAVMYGSLAMGWGLHNYPKITGLIIFLLVVAVLLAALSYNSLFPGAIFIGACSDIWPSAFQPLADSNRIVSKGARISPRVRFRID